MAEALGVAASVIQIVDAVSKLKNLWHGIKNAPDDLTDCVHDIQRTTRLLDKSKELFSSTTGIDNETLTECIQDLDNVLAALRGTSSDLQRALDSNKRLGALKIVLKKDELTRSRRKLERAQSLLNTAQQNLSLTLQLQHNSMLNKNHALLRQIYSVVEISSQSPLACSNTSHVSSSSAEVIVSDKKCEAQYATYSSRRISRGLQRANSSYYIRFPKWLTRRCFELACRREMSSLSFGLTSYNVVECNSPAFKAVWSGDLDKLKWLFETGHATPFDQTEYGRTLFTEALHFQNPDVAKFLVAQCPNLGSRMNNKSLLQLFWGWSPLHGVTDLPQHFGNLAQLWDLLTKYADVDQDVVCEVQRLSRKCGIPGLWAEWLPYICKIACQGIHTVPRETRASCAISALSFDVFKLLTSTDLSIREVLEINLNSQYNHTQLLGNVATEGRNELLKWSSVVIEIFNFDEQHGCAFRWVGSTLQKILNHVYHDAYQGYWHVLPSSMPELWNSSLRQWVLYLEDIGVNLMHYGERENRAISLHGLDYGCWRYVSFIYGPKAVDWKFCVVPNGIEYELAGEFWSWTENPELFFVPGNFLNDDTDDDEQMRVWMLDSEEQIRKKKKEKGRKEWQDKGCPKSVRLKEGRRRSSRRAEP